MSEKDQREEVFTPKTFKLQPRGLGVLIPKKLQEYLGLSVGDRLKLVRHENGMITFDKLYVDTTEVDD